MSGFNNHHHLIITLHPRKQDWNFFIFVINGNQAFTSEIYGVVGPLEKNIIFVVP